MNKGESMLREVKRDNNMRVFYCERSVVRITLNPLFVQRCVYAPPDRLNPKDSIEPWVLPHIHQYLLIPST